MSRPKKPVEGDTVTVADYGVVKWRVVSVDGELAHLKKLYSFEPVHYRDVPVERIKIVAGVVA